MTFIDWLTFTITVSRRLTNSYYIIMLIITLIAVFFLFRMRFKRFSMNLWLVSGLICLAWEIYLFTTGSRLYNFPPALELPYHALTEAGPGLIIMILFAHKIKLIDISEYADDYEPQEKKGSKKPTKKASKIETKSRTAKGKKSEKETKKEGIDSDDGSVIDEENMEE